MNSNLIRNLGQIEAQMITDYNRRITKFVMDIPTDFLFLTPEISELFGKMQQVKLGLTDTLQTMMIMLKKIEENLTNVGSSV